MKLDLLASRARGFLPQPLTTACFLVFLVSDEHLPSIVCGAVLVVPRPKGQSFCKLSSTVISQPVLPAEWPAAGPCRSSLVGPGVRNAPHRGGCKAGGWLPKWASPGYRDSMAWGTWRVGTSWAPAFGGGRPLYRERLWTAIKGARDGSQVKFPLNIVI